MQSKKKISLYCENLIQAWLDSKKRVSYIPILIAVVPSFLKALIDKSLNIQAIMTPANIVYAVVMAILFVWYYTSLDTKDKLEADKGYYDSEILALKEKTFENIRKTNTLWQYSRAIYQISQMGTAFDYALMHYRKMIEGQILTTEEVIDCTDSLMNSVYTIILKEYYLSEQEKLNFALYYYSPKLKKYLEIISYKHENSKSKKGRIWDENDNSHICFVGRQKECISIIYDNINKRLPMPLNSLSTDQDIYVSSISVPIQLKGSEHHDFILSLTSNFENRFNNDTSDEVINKINGLFSSTIINITTLLEIAYEKHLKNKDEEIIKIVLNDYKNKRPEELKKHKLEGILSNLS